MTTSYMLELTEKELFLLIGMLVSFGETETPCGGEVSIEIQNMNATAWCCWKCGRSFQCDIPFAADVKPQNWTPETEHFLLFAPVCTDCACLDGRDRARALYGRIEELETFVMRNPVLGRMAKPYIWLRIKELRTMLAANTRTTHHNPQPTSIQQPSEEI